MTMKMYDTIMEEENPKSVEQILDEMKSISLSVDTPDYLLHATPPQMNQSGEISLAFHLTLRTTNIFIDGGTEGEYRIDLSQVLSEPLQKIMEITGGPTEKVNITVPSILFSPNDKLTLNVMKFIRHHQVNSLQMYDAYPQEIVQGLGFYTPTIERGFPMYDTDTNKRVEKLKRRIEVVGKFLSKGNIEGTPYTMDIDSFHFNVNPEGVKNDGVIHVQDLVPIIKIKVNPSELGEQVRNKMGDLLDIPEDSIPDLILVV